jgi:membrane protein DedA with SNARE-associated domain
MISIESLAIGLASNPVLLFWLTLIATAVWGDISLIILTAFAVNYEISIWIIFLAAYIGTQIGDSLWYATGKYLEPKIERITWMKKGYLKVAEMIEALFGKRHLLALTVVKFLYGTRVIMIIYLAKQKIGYRKFFLYDLFATLFWVAGVGLVGYLIGLGFMMVKTFKNLQFAVTAFVLFIAIYFILEKNLRAFVENKAEKYKK